MLGQKLGRQVKSYKKTLVYTLEGTVLIKKIMKLCENVNDHNI